MAAALPVPVFYHMELNGRSRAALAVARLMGVRLQVREVDLFDQELLPADFLATNPGCTVPTLNDDGFVLTNSYVIATYLADKYGKNEELYPKSLKERSIVDDRLYFDAVILSASLRDYVCSNEFSITALLHGPSFAMKEKKKKIYEALGWLNDFFSKTEWVAGSHMTIADVFCAATVSYFQVLGLHLNRFPGVEKWMEQCQELLKDYDVLHNQGNQH